jgi:hypothetical protein
LKAKAFPPEHIGELAQHRFLRKREASSCERNHKKEFLGRGRGGYVDRGIEQTSRHLRLNHKAMREILVK